MLDLDPNAIAQSIAVIGMKGRFPGAREIEQFWENLCHGVEGITALSDEELLAQGVDPAWLEAPGYVKAAAPLDDIELFDALFFGFSARDAEMMDPQHRIFLETAWEAIEDAGYLGETYPGLIGVFGGTEMSHYLFNIYNNLDRLGFVDHFQIMVGNDKDHLTTHVSYKLNLRGPSIVCQTACSTSLVAVCTAIQSLLSYQCDIALAGGVALGLPQRQGYFYQPGGILSPDGHCRPFDAAAQGTVGGNGVAIVVLKRLAEAMADGDNIRAVIRGSAINNDGALKIGYTAPGIEGQAQCIALAQAVAGVSPETITYVEAHGTATPLGDPIEVAALTQVFRAGTQKKRYCALGSVKSNVGHLNAAAGATGLIKAVLAVERGKIPPTLHYSQPNSEIDFENSPFYVAQELIDWTATPRRAGVSSFGIGGTNAHVVLEQAPALEPASGSRPYQLLLLSARTSAALEKATDNLAGHLRRRPDQNFPDVAFTLHVGRKAFNHRRMLLCRTGGEAVQALESRDPGAVLTTMTEMRDRPVVFMFPGQGTQYPGMGRQLYEQEPLFREAVDDCCQLLKPYLNLDLRDLLFPAAGKEQEAAGMLRRTAFTQPALFVIEYSLAALWIKWGVIPSAMIGHSIGEYVAACLAGVLSPEDALVAVATRGALMESMQEGSMLSVPLSEHEVKPYLNGELSIAAVNAPALTVISGPGDAINQAFQKLAAHGIDSRPLHTSHAFHSPMMEPVVRLFVQQMRSFHLNSPTISYLSNVTGTWITPEQAVNPEYYGRQLRQAVRFSEGVRELIGNQDLILLELGPGQTLGALVRRHLSHRATPRSHQVILNTLPGAQENQPDQKITLEALGQFWLHGGTIDGDGFYANERRRRVSLPTYPFERQRYWIGDPVTAAAASAKVRDIGQWFYLPSWKAAAATAPATSSTSQASSTWAIFADGCAIGEHLSAELRRQGGRVVIIRPGERCESLSDDLFTLRPQERGDYESLIAWLMARQSSTDSLNIVHLWSVTDEATEAGADTFAQRQRMGFHSLLKLAQGLEKERVTTPVQIGVVTNQLQTVIGDEQLCPDKATILGACKVIPQEYPNLRCKAIDISLADAPQVVAGSLFSEMSVEPFEPVVAYRKGRRWLQTFDAAAIEKPDQPPPRLRQNGVYLITGGMGQIGLILAEALAESVQARLVLTGRSAFPKREEWNDYLLANPADAVTRKIRRLQKIEALGAEVFVARADSADLAQMRRAVDEAVAHFGAIHGVIHGAGNTSAEAAFPLSRTDEAAAAAHFRPKAEGLYVLDQLFEGREVDFFFLLSSLSAILGGLGFAGYAAGNVFLDAFAAAKNVSDARPWISVNWDAWQFADENLAKPAASLSDFILPDDGKDAFLRILNLAPRQIVVSTSDLRQRLDQWVRLESLQSSQTGPASQPTGYYPRPNLSTQFVTPKTEVERTIAGVWEHLLGVAPIGLHDKFFELGGHSLLAIQVISRIREVYRVELPVQKLFEAPSVSQLAECIEGELDAAQTSDAQMEDILKLVENLNEEEVQALLEQHGITL